MLIVITRSSKVDGQPARKDLLSGWSHQRETLSPDFAMSAAASPKRVGNTEGAFEKS